MRRRDFIALIGGATATWPVKALAQQTGKLPTIGFLGASASGFAPWAAAFVARLRELGWIEGRTVAIEYRWSEGRPERYAEIAAEFVRLKVDVILTVGSAVPIVKQATTAIPIVFAVAIDPVGSGLVASLAKPGGNVTGLSIQANELAGKRLELLHEVMPELRRLAIMFNADNTQPVLEMGELRPRLAGWASKSRRSLSGGPKTSRPRSKTLRPKLTRFMLLSINLSLPIAHASSRLHLANACPQSLASVISLKPERLCPTDQVTQIYSDTRQTTWTGFCAGRSLAIYQSSSQPNSSLSSTLRRRRHSA